MPTKKSGQTTRTKQITQVQQNDNNPASAASLKTKTDMLRGAPVAKLRPWSALSGEATTREKQKQQHENVERSRPKTSHSERSTASSTDKPGEGEQAKHTSEMASSKLHNSGDYINTSVVSNPSPSMMDKLQPKLKDTQSYFITKSTSQKRKRLRKDSKLSQKNVSATDNTKKTRTPWSVTELPEEDTDSVSEASEEIKDEYAQGIPEDEEEEERNEEDRKRSGTPVQQVNNMVASKAQLTLDSLLFDLDTKDEEYDTDLEDNFPPEPDPPLDPTGADVYEKICKQNGLIPVSYLIRNLGEPHIRMRHHYLGGQGTRPLAAAFKKNTICEEVDLGDNYLEGDGAVALAHMLRDNMFITNLNVANNFLGSKGADAFGEMLETNTTLKTLSLQGNHLIDSDARPLAEALKNNMSLSCLDISHNEFGEQGGIYLGSGLAVNLGLSDVDLSWNHIREKGAVAIIKALHTNTSLEILDLSWNGLAMPGAVALQKALKVNNRLKVLDISNNRINTEAAKKLAQGLSKNEGLETLLMGMNPIGDVGVEAVLKAVSQHPTLRLLGLEDIRLSPLAETKIKELLAARDIMILYSSGSPQQTKIQAGVMALFDRFINDNQHRLEDLFNQLDKDKSGDVTLEELKYGLKDSGLRLTSKQLDILLEEIDTDKSGTIEYSELLNGTAMIKREKEKVERAAREAEYFKEVADNRRTTKGASPAVANGAAS